MTRWIAITAAFVNLGIHLSMTPDHLAEKPYIGILFVIGSALLGAVMIGLASDRDRLRTAAWAGGAPACAAEVTLFVLSRTTGLPQCYHEAWGSGLSPRGWKSRDDHMGRADGSAPSS